MTHNIVIIGGYNSAWPLYLGAARRLEAVTGRPAVAVPIMPWHWWGADRSEDATPLLQKLAGTLDWSRRRHGVERSVLVGHSAGGLLARLYLADGAVWGHHYNGVGQVARVFTLGSPHCGLHDAGTGWYLSDAANDLAPGAPRGDTIPFCAVAGRILQGRKDGSYFERRAYRRYRFFTGEDGAWGDGTVPVDCARLDGAQDVVLEGVAHSLRTIPTPGAEWYLSSAAVIRRWWPEACA
jgi:pimeloyl-ACP methyl ester carboxylesterase